MKTNSQKTAINAALKVAIVRNARFKNQREFAQKAGIGEVRLSAIIHGHVIATRDDKRAIARALRCRQADVFPQPKPKPEAVVA